MAVYISEWLNPNNFAQLRDKFNGLISKIVGGSNGQVLCKNSSDDGDFAFKNILDLMPTGQPWKTFVSDLSEAPFSNKWIAVDGKTLGNGASTADYTGDTYKALFLFLWSHFTNAVCPVTTGRSADALSDYNANKKISLPDARGRFGVSFDPRTSDPTNGIWDIDYSVMGKSKITLGADAVGNIGKENLPTGVMLGGESGGSIGGYDVELSTSAGAFKQAKQVSTSDTGLTILGNVDLTSTMDDQRPPLIVDGQLIIKL